MIEKEEKEVTHLYLHNGTETDDVKFITAKFYITNWESKGFIRRGKFIIVNRNLEDKIVTMPSDYLFEFNINDVNDLIIKAANSRKAIKL